MPHRRLVDLARVGMAGKGSSAMALRRRRPYSKQVATLLATVVRAKQFVRGDGDQQPPLAQLVSTGGRGGAAAVKLYLALIWRCSAAPFDTDISARKWAALQDLEDPTHKGARRVTAALQRLAGRKLIRVEERRGESSKITLLDESASGRAYSLPSTAYTLGKPAEKPGHIYFKVPVSLWTSGHLQDMSAAALAMLLAMLAETTEPRRKIWWSAELFPSEFAISPAMRARGPRELVQRRLLLVQKQLVQDSPKRDFGKERVRNLYQLINEAEPRPTETPPTPKAKRPRRSTGRPKTAASVR
ncbi:hypothetical protein [Lapillicoccus sp.]|uniref:hypothetical protein n=1 Tax=Lapillicoccus sp. TaxID=1909287 RepID=UPI0025DBD407|nr:hypothetical protein [Lapillicoccus sp.]